jgi:tRNA pseudouridine55 synthase
VINKPAGWTSHDVVAKCRWLAGTRKVGHGGTLDPMATGVLVVAVGKATKLLTYVSGSDKSYTATIRLGIGTITDDAEGEVTEAPGFVLGPPEPDPPGHPAGAVSTLGHPAGSVSPARHPAGAVSTLGHPTGADSSPRHPAGSGGASQDLYPALTAAIAQLTGNILQVPSAVSAIKVDGKRSYARVRAGQDVELAPRPVTVSAFDVLGIRPTQAQVECPEPQHGVGILQTVELGEFGRLSQDAQRPTVETPVVDIDVSVTVSSGTYVRALARDLGALLGTAGHLTALCRTRVGDVSLDQARNLDDLIQWAEQNLQTPLETMPMADAARRYLPVRIITEDEARALGFGQWITPTGTPGPHAAITDDDRLAALVEDTRRQGKPHAKPVLVF